MATHLSRAEVKKTIKQYIYPASGSFSTVYGEFYIYLNPYCQDYIPVVGPDNWKLNDSHINEAIKCQYLRLMLSILRISLHESYI